MVKVRLERATGSHNSNAFNKGKATLTFAAGTAVTADGADVLIAGVPKAVKFPAGWTVAAGTISFLASFDDVTPGPGQDLSDVMEVVRDGAGVVITMTATAGQTHLVPATIRDFISAFNYVAIVSGVPGAEVNQVAEAQVDLFFSAEL